MLTEVDQFLRSPAGHAALEEYYAARGSTGPGFRRGRFSINWVSFTALWLRGRTQPQAQRSPDSHAGPAGRAGWGGPSDRFSCCFFFFFFFFFF